ncbi:MAG TPA: sugar phosphate isomerase/epimerase [Trueperaceae bacterium]|nr:sugar phosphate isomerase/epimerase [Trueperaceae bacterium]
MTTPRIPQLALQLYTLRGLRLPFPDLVSRAAEAGYSGVETVGSHGADADAAREALAAHGVRVCSSHVGLADLETDPDAVCGFNLALGNDVVVVPWLPPERRGHDPASWQALGRRLGDLARRCRDRGVRLLYHHHDFELTEVGGRTGLAWLAEAAGEGLGLEPDLGWAQRAGTDPAALLAGYPGRCPRVHLKDLARPGEGGGEDGWAAVGDGVMPWAALLTACRQAGAEWFVVEHDAPRDPLAAAQRSARYLETLL